MTPAVPAQVTLILAFLQVTSCVLPCCPHTKYNSQTKRSRQSHQCLFLESLIKTVCCDSSERFPLLRFGMEMTCREVCPHLAPAEVMQPAWLCCSLLSSFCPSSHCNNSPPPLSPGSRSLCTLCSQLHLWEPGTKQSFDFEVCIRCAQESPATEVQP